MARQRRVNVRTLPDCGGRIKTAELRRIARHVMTEEGVAPEVEVEVVLADAGTVQELNRLYRGQDQPTDVLSFASAEAGPFVAAPDEPPSLGEVIVCLAVAEEQARAASHAIEAEIAHLVVHGLLHILGYNHEDAAESARMKRREDEVLAALGYAGEYAHGH